MANFILGIALAATLGFGAVPAALARNVPGHPHVNELDQRLLNQQGRIDAGVNQGQIGVRGEARDQALDAGSQGNSAGTRRGPAVTSPGSNTASLTAS